jgi:hypothetical protein
MKHVDNSVPGCTTHYANSVINPCKTTSDNLILLVHSFRLDEHFHDQKAFILSSSKEMEYKSLFRTLTVLNNCGQELGMS